MGGMIDFKRPDGGTCKGYLAEAGKDKPGIVVIQEWWGLNDQIKGVAERFAKAGYNALAPDLYKGRVTQKPDEANHMMSGLDFVGVLGRFLVLGELVAEAGDQGLQRRDEYRYDIAVDEQLDAEGGGSVGFAEPGVPVQQFDERPLRCPEKRLLEASLEDFAGGPGGLGAHLASSSSPFSHLSREVGVPTAGRA